MKFRDYYHEVGKIIVIITKKNEKFVFSIFHSFVYYETEIIHCRINLLYLIMNITELGKFTYLCYILFLN